MRNLFTSRSFSFPITTAQYSASEAKMLECGVRGTLFTLTLVIVVTSCYIHPSGCGIIGDEQYRSRVSSVEGGLPLSWGQGSERVTRSCRHDTCGQPEKDPGHMV